MTRRVHSFGSGAMIGMLVEDRYGSVDLFGQHHTNQLMRQGHRRQRKHKLRRTLERFVQAIGPADREGHVVSLVPPAPDRLRELSRAVGLAALIERHEDRAAWLCH